MSIQNVLVVDDEPLMRHFLEETLLRLKLQVCTAENGKKALAALKTQAFDLVITDMKMPDTTGLDIIKKVKEHQGSIPIIVITAFGSVENAVEAMHLGASHYLIKPFSADAFEAVLKKVSDYQRLCNENTYLKQNTDPLKNKNQIIAKSPQMQAIMRDVEKIAQSNASVFITGESGTGKEVIASAIHDLSERNNKPFIRVNCAAVPETLIEAEFFGHEKGAFTGAASKRLGRFELAHQGSLLLDEVTEIPINLQAKLLRAVQEQEIERLGTSHSIPIDVRFIATSNHNVQESVNAGVFREDLYYRLNVVPLHLPPLRERLEDIIPLAEYYLERACQENHKEPKEFSAASKKALLTHKWPGNIRELTNLIERAVVLENVKILEPKHLQIDNLQSTREFFRLSEPCTLEEMEKKLILKMLEYSKDPKEVAKELGIKPKELEQKIKAYKIKLA